MFPEDNLEISQRGKTGGVAGIFLCRSNRMRFGEASPGTMPRWRRGFEAPSHPLSEAEKQTNFRKTFIVEISSQITPTTLSSPPLNPGQPESPGEVVPKDSM